MSLYAVSTRSRRVQAAYERSPRIATVDVAAFRKLRPASDTDASIIQLAGERYLQGSKAGLRHRLRDPGLCLHIPVHYPALPELGVDLIGLEPRAFHAAPRRDAIDTDFRIAAAQDDSRSLFYTLRDSTEPWACLSVALVEAAKDIQWSMDRLRRLWTREDTPPVLRSLILRNLIVLLIKSGDRDKAREVLNLGMEGFPEYAELRYLSALLWLLSQKFTAAMHDAERAMAISTNAQWIGSGGETTYRPAWIKGACAAIAGNQEMAVKHFLPGLCARPALRPAIEALLDSRLATSHVARLSLELCNVVRSDLHYLPSVFQYLLLHRCFSAARRLAETLVLTEDVRNNLIARVTSAESPFIGEASGDGAGIVIQAPFFQQSSIGRIGRELATGLLDNPDLDICLEPDGYATQAKRDVPHGPALSQAMLRHPRALDLTIRMTWPPDFRRPTRGKLAVVFPWEYRGLPEHWVRQMRDNCDEVWTPSEFVAGVLRRAGMDANRIRVIPNGIDPAIFSPDAPVAPVPEARGFVFLFVGGAIERKGFDLLLDAYEEAFTAADDVTLLIKETGCTSFYRHNSLVSRTGRFAQGPAGRSRMPHVILNNAPMDDATLAGLYRRADCLVHPYRGEGFGMTLVEAMACGTPVITTNAGPAPEYCDESTGWLISAKHALVPDDPPPAGPMTEPLAWFTPSFDELIAAMRAAYENREECVRRGERAARRIHATHTWPRIMETYATAARELCAGVGVPA